MATEITDTDVATAALSPAEAESDAGRVKARSIDELLAAQNALAGTAAAARIGFGMRVSKLEPGGTG